ncbi:50S ribosomal protein L3 [Blochmannia endosymbiont of Polyrhachis (Hedomyrma) turneri]|uniref:50S ribosomal protein L3 n=1 Tax=Blochmannia endosymbiont of Polyrhachis (Hedomyrma) turneri TaxID=1505596 RepID=UPI00061A885E|nr:50S ribosomal protein L3 [Blochmannia endosymbiont of Polyrhachis (Hedomyrma) turneri]AKC59769.1 50S ribosomal protein L3 [Blochmannia endosymbiont of Polyrhachis (Hedomyrma) turneri]
MIGLTGMKAGMTRFFIKDGVTVPVTIIKVEPHRVIQVKTLKTDGYNAVQVTAGVKKLNRVNKPEIGHVKKSGMKLGHGLWEFRMRHCCDQSICVGDVITVSLFTDVKQVDVTGISKGKGFSGTVKRWNFCSQDASHGNSLSHRAPGSIGQNQTPGKVFKGKKMPGHLGNMKVTVQNLHVVLVDLKNNLLVVKGSIPGEVNSIVRVSISEKL